MSIAQGGVDGGAPCPLHPPTTFRRTSAVHRRGAEAKEPKQLLEAEATGGLKFSALEEMTGSRGNYERSVLGARPAAALLMIFPPKPRVERGGTAT